MLSLRKFSTKWFSKTSPFSLHPRQNLFLKSLEVNSKMFYSNTSHLFNSEAKPIKFEMNPSILIRNVLNPKRIGEKVCVSGWVKWIKVQKEIAFIHLDDGSSPIPLQVVCTTEPKSLKHIASGTSVRVEGTLVTSSGREQAVELQLSSFCILGGVDPLQYPLQPKSHSLEFLREIAHFRPRTKQFAAVLRLRNASTIAIHNFLQSFGFLQVHTPVLTTNDCEGGGATFRVSAMTPTHDNKMEEFFKKPTFLTVSGQLHAEMMACGLSRVYSFGPTFRAETGITSKHLAEFWMLEPEIAFCDLKLCMDIQEQMVKYITLHLLDNFLKDLQVIHENTNPNLVKELERLVNTEFPRITHAQAVKILKEAHNTANFKFPVSPDGDLQTEHERYLAEVHFKNTPVFVYDWPKNLKPFYMRSNDDGQTVSAADLLVPNIGELIGGSAREERLDLLQEAISKTGLNSEGQLNWYLDLRKFGTVPHAGFGMGFERYIQFVTGINNIRDVIPLPRYSGSCNY